MGIFNREAQHWGTGRYVIPDTVADDCAPFDLPIEEAREVADGTNELIDALSEGRDLLGYLTVAEIVELKVSDPREISGQPKN